MDRQAHDARCSSVFGHGVSGRDLILIVGGLFLIGKATFEIHGKLEGEEHERRRSGPRGALAGQRSSRRSW